MEEVTTQHTIAIFRHLYEFVRGALPADLQAEMEHALDHVERDTELTREDIEHTMIVFGKKVWPYRKALQEMVEHTEGTMGDQLFRSSLSRSMQKRFQEFLDHGGSLRDIHSGGAVHFFSSEERVELNHALVDMHEHLRAFTVQRIRGIGARDFDTRVSDSRTSSRLPRRNSAHPCWLVPERLVSETSGCRPRDAWAGPKSRSCFHYPRSAASHTRLG